MLNRLSIRYKISLIALIGLAGIIIFQLSSYLLSEHIRNQLQNIVSEDFVLLQFANEIQVSFSDLDKLYLGAYSESEEDILQEANQKAAKMLSKFDETQNRYHISNPVFKQLHLALKNYVKKASLHTAFVISTNPGWEKQRQGWEELTVLRENYINLERQFIQQQYQTFELKLKNIESQESTFVLIGLIIGTFISILLALFSILIIRHLLHAINYAVKVAELIATGKFDEHIETSSTDETGRLINALVTMRDELKTLVLELKEKSNFLRTQRSEIMQKNMELEQSGSALLEKKAALEQSNRYKSQFLSTMSHELRTPLNSIIILSDALKQNRLQHLDDKEVQHAKVIHSAGEDLLELINDILDLSKVEEGKMEFVVDDIIFSEFAVSITQLFEFMAAEKNLEFKVSISNDLPDAFFSDKYRLKQIMKNFISNALKFTEQGGVYVNFCKADESFFKNHPQITVKNAILLSVKDTGIGVDITKQSLIFEAFRQADGTTSRKYGGTGLGLSISSSLAKLLGGEIVLDSDGLGCGSTFTLILPILNEVDIAAHSTALLSKPLVSNITKAPSHTNELLIVLNDENNANDIIKAAALFNIEAKFVATKEELLLLIAGHHYSLALIQKPLLSHFSEQEKQDTIDAIDQIFYVDDESRSNGRYTLNDYSQESIQAFLTEIVNYKKLHAYCVLVIEDNPVFQEVVKALFTAHFINVEVAADGASALSILQVRQFDCLVVDLNLPDVTGLDLLKQIRSFSSYIDTPVIVFTAEEINRESENDIAVYATKILTKTPKTILALHTEIKSLIASRLIHSYKRKKMSYVPGLLKGRRILLIDDDPRNIYSIIAILEAEQVHVDAMQSGQEALDWLSKQPVVDLILLDIMMPEMDGYEVLAILREDPQWKKIPIIAVTAKAQNQDRERCFQMGANDYLSKPVERKLLLDCITVNLS